MTLESWMDNRKIVLLNERKNQLFQTLRHTPQFRLKRSELHAVLTQIEERRRNNMAPPPSPNRMLGIAYVA